MSRRRKVASRHIADLVTYMARRLPNTALVTMAREQPLSALQDARKIVSAFQLGSTEAHYLALAVAYEAGTTLMSRPIEREHLAGWLGEKSSRPQALDTLRLAVRYLYDARDTGTSRYSRCCKYAHVLDEARIERVPVDDLREFVKTNGGIEKLHKRALARKAEAAGRVRSQTRGVRQAPPAATSRRPTRRPAAKAVSSKPFGEIDERIQVDPAEDLVVHAGDMLPDILAHRRGKRLLLEIEHIGFREGRAQFEVRSIDDVED